MPVAYVKNLADKYGVSLGKVEKEWDAAKKSVGPERDTPVYWGTVMKVFKAMINKHLGFSESRQRIVVEKELGNLSEATFMDLYNGSEDKRKSRVPSVKKRSLKRKVNEDGSILYSFAFESVNPASTGIHKGFVKIEKDNSVEVSCSCKDFLYVWEVANENIGVSSIVHSNGADPVIKNPDKLPGLCKHLLKMKQFLSPDEKE